MAGKSGHRKAKPTKKHRKYYRNLVGRKAGNISTYRAQKGDSK